MARQPRKSKLDKRLNQGKSALVATEVLGHPAAHAIDVAKTSTGALQHGAKASTLLGYASYKAITKMAQGGSAGDATLAAVDAVTFGLGTYAIGGQATGNAASGRLASRRRATGANTPQTEKEMKRAANSGPPSRAYLDDAAKSKAAKRVAVNRPASKPAVAAPTTGGAKRGFANPAVQKAAQAARRVRGK